MRRSNYSRRRFLAAMPTAFTSVALFRSTQAQGRPAAQNSVMRDTQGLVAGSIERTAAYETLIVYNRIPSYQGSVIVNISDQTTISRGDAGVLESIAAFQVGDEVVIEGRWQNGQFIASNVMTMYQHFAGTIRQHNNDFVDTSNGSMYLSSNVWVQTNDGVISTGFRDKHAQAALAAGNSLAALTWNDITNQKRIGIRILVDGV